MKILAFGASNSSESINSKLASKNLFDWVSRINSKVFQNKLMLILSTAPGKGGAASILSAAVESAPFYGADVKASLSVPSFFENFDVIRNRIVKAEISQKIDEAIKLFTQSRPAPA